MRRSAIAVIAVLCAALLLTSAAASAEDLNPRVKEAVDKAKAADKAAVRAADLAKQAAADAVKAAKTAIERASAVRAMAESSLEQFTPKEGVRVQGRKTDGKISGPCIVQLANGTRYEGECRDNSVAGYGVEVAPSGFRYEGVFEGAKRQGAGRGTYSDGSRYEGQWLADQRAGYGVVTTSMGDSYFGHVSQGRPDGSGTRKLPDGSGYSGDWREGRADGFGVHVLPEGSFYMGQWAQNKYDGAGIFASRLEKKIVQGVWEKGVLKQELGPALASSPPGQPPAAGAAPQPGAPPKKSGPAFAGNGTGFFVTKAGHIVTNDHVTRGCTSLKVHSVGEPSVAVRLVATSQAEDLSLLKAAEAAETIASLRSEPALRAGDGVVVFGFPLTGLVASTGNLTTGNVSALAGIGDSTHLLQISAPVQPGNSGGPLLDLSGNVIGVVEMKLNAALVASKTGDIPQNINFAIKASVVASFLEAHNVRYQSAPAGADLSVADVGERARAFTVMVECYK